MDRLTTEFCGEYVPRELCSMDRLGGADDCDLCFEHCKAMKNPDEGTDCQGCAISACFNRLGEYEDTGLSPGQVREMDGLYKEKCRELAGYKTLLWQQCGMQPPPCAVGQQVYMIGRNRGRIIPGEVVSIRIGAVTSSLRIYIPETGQYVNRAFEQIGKSVFFDQAAAGEALEKSRLISREDAIMINGQIYSKKKLCLDWFGMSNDSFFQKYGFNFNPHVHAGLYEWGRSQVYGG